MMAQQCTCPGQGEQMNLHLLEGLSHCIEKMAQVKPEGLVLLSPTCSSWTWLCLGTSLRTLVPRLALESSSLSELVGD